MRPESVSHDSLADAFRILRRTANLNLGQVTRRTHVLGDPFLPLTMAEIKGFEKGEAVPSIWQLLSLLIGCSHDGQTLCFKRFDLALRMAALGDDVDVLTDPGVEMVSIARELVEAKQVLRDVDNRLRLIQTLCRELSIEPPTN